MTSWKRYDVMEMSTVGVHGNEVTKRWQLKKCIFDGILFNLICPGDIPEQQIILKSLEISVKLSEFGNVAAKKTCCTLKYR
jgi:hypothetical protein